MLVVISIMDYRSALAPVVVLREIAATIPNLTLVMDTVVITVNPIVEHVTPAIHIQTPGVLHITPLQTQGALLLVFHALDIGL
jgi:hypothetical protein